MNPLFTYEIIWEFGHFKILVSNSHGSDHVVTPGEVARAMALLHEAGYKGDLLAMVKSCIEKVTSRPSVSAEDYRRLTHELAAIAKMDSLQEELEANQAAAETNLQNFFMTMGFRKGQTDRNGKTILNSAGEPIFPALVTPDEYKAAYSKDGIAALDGGLPRPGDPWPFTEPKSVTPDEYEAEFTYFKDGIAEDNPGIGDFVQPKDFMTQVLKFSDEEATAILQDCHEKAIAEYGDVVRKDAERIERMTIGVDPAETPADEPTTGTWRDKPKML